MSEPQRVRVTGPPRRRLRLDRARDIDQETRLGGVYLRSLLAEQLRLALGTLLVLVLCVGSLPLLFHLAPGLTAVHLLGLPVAWLVLGIGVYPLLIALGWRFVRRAERNEDHFADLLRHRDGPTDPGDPHVPSDPTDRRDPPTASGPTS